MVCLDRQRCTQPGLPLFKARGGGGKKERERGQEGEEREREIGKYRYTV